MYLHEEYLKRNALDVPLVLYNRKSVVLLKNIQNPSMWGIISITWREPDRHPGFFMTNYSSVIHNGWETDQMIGDKINPDIWYCDEYEAKLMKVIAGLKERNIVAVEKREQVLAIWHIFLIIYDSWLAKNMSGSFLKEVGISLNSNMTIEERMFACQNAQNMLMVNKSVYDVWLYQIWPLTKTKSEWLVRLIND